MAAVSLTLDITDIFKEGYKPGQSHGGAGRRKFKPSEARKPSASLMSEKVNRRHGNQRRLSAAWMLEGTGCFVHGGDHLARQQHGRDGIASVINRLKSLHPTTLLNKED